MSTSREVPVSELPVFISVTDSRFDQPPGGDVTDITTQWIEEDAQQDAEDAQQDAFDELFTGFRFPVVPTNPE
jgi:hypothetical protein